MSEPSDQDAAKTPKATETPADPHRRPHLAGWMPDPPEHADTNLDDVLRRRVPVRIRVAQTVALLIVIAVAAGLVVHNLLVAPGHSQAGIATPTPIPLGPILLLSNVSYGTMTLNGAPLAGSPPLVATFRRGPNTLTLTAPPFRPRTCHIQWPDRQTDGDCDLSTGVTQLHYVGGLPVAPVLTVILPVHLEDLPTAAQTQALANVTGALQHIPPQTRVPAGDYIATGQEASGAIVSRRAAEPLQAELLAAATTLVFTGNVFCADPSCAPIGNVATGQPGSRAQWVVAADVSIHWQFSSSAGVVATSPSWSTQLPTSLVLIYDAQQGWTVVSAAQRNWLASICRWRSRKPSAASISPC